MVYIKRKPIPEEEKKYFRYLRRAFKKKVDTIPKEERKEVAQRIYQHEDKWLEMVGLASKPGEYVSLRTISHQLNFMDFISMYVVVEMDMKNLDKLDDDEYMQPIIQKAMDYVIWRNGKDAIW